MSMTKKEIHAFIHGAACACAGRTVSDEYPDEEGNFCGLNSEMSAEQFGDFVNTIRLRFVTKGTAYMVQPWNLGKFESVPSATEFIWSRREHLKPWRTDDDN